MRFMVAIKYYIKKKNKITDLAIKFFDNEKIFTLCNKNSKLKGENIIKFFQDDNMIEYGFFYALCYGKINDYFTFEIMDGLDDFSDLLSEVNLWVNKLDLLNKYVKYKYVLQCYGSNYNSDKINIEDKIQDYQNECLKLQTEKKVYIDTFFTKEKVGKNKKKKLVILKKK